MKYYIIACTGGVTLKYKGEGDINRIVKDYIDKQNRGEAKSDRFYLYKITKVSEQRYSTYYNGFEITKLVNNTN